MKPSTLLLIAAIALAFAGIAYRLVTGESMREALRQAAGKLACRILGHRRARETVRKIETTYRGRCRVCGIKLIREGRDGPWQVARLAMPPPTMAASAPETE